MSAKGVGWGWDGDTEKRRDRGDVLFDQCTAWSIREGGQASKPARNGPAQFSGLLGSIPRV